MTLLAFLIPNPLHVHDITAQLLKDIRIEKMKKFEYRNVTKKKKSKSNLHHLVPRQLHQCRNQQRHSIVVAPGIRKENAEIRHIKS